MTNSPTPTELLALRTANAALLNSADSFCDMVATVVFALGSAQLLRAESTPEDSDPARSLDLLSLMSERSAAVVSGHLARLLGEQDRLRARVAELEAERHSTNEALDDAAQALRRDRDRIAELEAGRNRPAPVLAPAMGPGQQRLAERAMAELEATHYQRLGLTPPATREDPHDSPLHHPYLVGRDLPEYPNA